MSVAGRAMAPPGRRGQAEYLYGYRAVLPLGKVGLMTTPLSASARSHGRGLNLVIAGAGLLALGWVCAMSYVLVVWTLT